LTSFARAEKIDCLFTDSKISSEWQDRLRQAGIEFTICEEEAAPIK